MFCSLDVYVHITTSLYEGCGCCLYMIYLQYRDVVGREEA